MTSLVHWDPFGDLQGMQRGFDRLLTRWPLLAERSQTYCTPAVDVFRRDEDMVVRAELPGAGPDDVELTVEGDLLTIRSSTHEEENIEEEDFMMREMVHGTYERTLRIPEGIETSDINADFSNGVLEITLPRAATVAPKAHKIEIARHKSLGHKEKAA